jgi:hypothetical protein
MADACPMDPVPPSGPAQKKYTDWVHIARVGRTAIPSLETRQHATKNPRADFRRLKPQARPPIAKNDLFSMEATGTSPILRHIDNNECLFQMRSRTVDQSTHLFFDCNFNSIVDRPVRSFPLRLHLGTTVEVRTFRSFRRR